jgi:hypothetical protein
MLVREGRYIVKGVGKLLRCIGRDRKNVVDFWEFYGFFYFGWFGGIDVKNWELEGLGE